MPRLFVSEHGREVLSPWVSEASDVMSDKIRHIEVNLGQLFTRRAVMANIKAPVVWFQESEPPKKSGMMAQMWQMMGAR